MFIQTTSQLPSVQNDVLTGQYAGLHLYVVLHVVEYILSIQVFFFLPSETTVVFVYVCVCIFFLTDREIYHTLCIVYYNNYV